MSTPTPPPPQNYANYPRQAPHPAGDPCPQCGQYAAKAVQYTWWGGVVGPRMMNMSRCAACKFEFNRKTGQSTRKAIIMYNVIAGVVLLLMILSSWMVRRQ